MSNNPFPLEEGDPGTPFHGAHADRDGSESKTKELHSYLAADAAEPWVPPDCPFCGACYGHDPACGNHARSEAKRLHAELERAQSIARQALARAERAEAEVMRYQTGSAYEVGHDHGSATAGLFKDRAERAEATLDRVRALADTLGAFDCVEDEDDVPSHVDVPDDYETGLHDAAERLRAILDAPHPEAGGDDE